MNLNRLKAVAVKEVLQVWRDPRSLMIALLMPVMQMLLLGYGVSLDAKNVPVCTYDREASQQSTALLKRFEASPYFAIVKAAGSYREVTAALDGGECRLAIVIPADFSQRLADTGASAVQAILDATDDNTARLALSYGRAVVTGFSSEIALRFSARYGQLPPPVPLAVQSRVWFNEDLESRNFIIPGVIALVMALIGAQLTSLTISREWERGTMELLVSTPVTPGELMLGKLLPYFAIGGVDAALCIAFAVLWYGVPFRGTVVALSLATVLFLFVVLGIGYLFSVLVRSQIGASQLALLATMLPATLLSGFVFPIDQMPAPIRAVTYLVHARYYVTALKAVFLKGLGVAQLGAPLAAMAIYAAVLMALAARAFRKKLD